MNDMDQASRAGWSGFTLRAEQHLLMRNQTAQPDAVNPIRRPAPAGSRQFPVSHWEEPQEEAAPRADAILPVFAAVPDGCELSG